MTWQRMVTDNELKQLIALQEDSKNSPEAFALFQDVAIRTYPALLERLQMEIAINRIHEIAEDVRERQKAGYFDPFRVAKNIDLEEFEDE